MPRSQPEIESPLLYKVTKSNQDSNTNYAYSGGGAMLLRCNSCWEVLIGGKQHHESMEHRGSNGNASTALCFRTACNHIFCQTDAYRHFGNGELICPICQTDLTDVPKGIVEVSLRGRLDPKRLEHIWSETLTDPSSVLEQVQRGISFMLFQSNQESVRQESHRLHIEQEMKACQSQYGERYIKIKSYADELEAELEEVRQSAESLKVSHNELQEAYKERSRKARNWEKLYKTAKAQIQATHQSIAQQNVSTPNLQQNPTSYRRPLTSSSGSTRNKSSLHNAAPNRRPLASNNHQYHRRQNPSVFYQSSSSDKVPLTRNPTSTTSSQHQQPVIFSHQIPTATAINSDHHHVQVAQVVGGSSEDQCGNTNSLPMENFFSSSTGSNQRHHVFPDRKNRFFKQRPQTPVASSRSNEGGVGRGNNNRMVHKRPIFNL